MLIHVILINSAGRLLGTLAVEETDTIVHYGGSYFAKSSQAGIMPSGAILPYFIAPASILTTYRLDSEFTKPVAECSAPASDQPQQREPNHARESEKVPQRRRR